MNVLLDFWIINNQDLLHWLNLGLAGFNSMVDKISLNIIIWVSNYISRYRHFVILFHLFYTQLVVQDAWILISRQCKLSIEQIKPFLISIRSSIHIWQAIFDFQRNHVPMPASDGFLSWNSSFDWPVVKVTTMCSYLDPWENYMSTINKYCIMHNEDYWLNLSFCNKSHCTQSGVP